MTPEPADAGHRQLGSELRGGRLGYRWHPRLCAYIKVQDRGDGFRVIVAPTGQIPTDNTRRLNHHRCWWEGANDGVADELGRIVLRAVAPVGGRNVRLRRVVELDLNADGNLEADR